ncbi:sensor histidine kinase [Geothrix sp. PMB-07]|uniref:sensor histidine kinase n=1 Tax=Geothrix sp. PMB-07 TaxID=3068640 RepID=UPI002742368F|nr:histidine kinase [Geothrix sp. PMB-07]WLT30049.1 histidine kinase [Geothrix sp. PMB-07]
MRFQEALQAVARRSRRPAILALAGSMCLFNLGLVGLGMLAQRVAPPSATMPPAILNLRLVLCTILGCGFLFMVSPFSWQWTGDGRRMAPPRRGIPQALLLHIGYSLVNIAIGWPNFQKSLTFATHAPQSKPIGFLPLMGVGLLLGFAFNVVLSFALAFWEAKTHEKQEALRQAEEARWSLLKAQMSPHVLLNSLNGLAELVRDDTEAAVKGMRDLAEIYRQLLTLGETPTVPLREERHLLSRYLDVEKLRLGETLQVDWDWDPALDAIAAMPLLLQPLVENAIKHGVAADPNGGLIRISGQRAGGHLILAVANTGQAAAPTSSKGTGVGLRNLRSRLELAYGGRASFDLVREWPWTRAILKLPLEEKP